MTEGRPPPILLFMKLIDLHCDTLLRILEEEASGLPSILKKNPWHVDLEKLNKADSLVQIFAIFVPPAHKIRSEEIIKNNEIIEQYRFFLSQYDLFKREMEINKRVVRQLTSHKDIRRNDKKGLISAMLSIEEGNVLDGKIERLEEFHEMGIRLITLLWNHENCLGYPHSPDNTRMVLGLKPFGKEAVKRMEELGMIIDVSHLSDGGFDDVVSLTKKPFVASHSNARAVAGSSRNLKDSQIRTLADRGGVMGINFFGEFLSDAPNPVSRVSHMVDHIRHIRNIGGMDVLALGTDFDGIDGEMEIGDVAHIFLLEQALDRAGFTVGEIEKIWSGNALRLFADVL